MEKEKIFQKFKEIACKTVNDLDEYDILPESRLDKNLGLDSLDIVEIIMGLEKTYGIELPMEEYHKLSTVADVCNLVATQLSKEKEENQNNKNMEKIKKIIAEQLQLPLEDIHDNDSFLNDLGADSLEKVEISMAVEKAYTIHISDDEFLKIQTVGDLCQLVEQKHPA